MKYILTLILFLASCTQSTQTDNFIVKYGSQEIKSAEFINTLMILGFTKHGKSFYSKIYDEAFFEKARTETLEQVINNLFFGSLSQKYKVKITDLDLEEWIKERTPDMQKEDLIYTLKANNLTYADWKGLFRNQMIKNKIIEQVEGVKEQKIKPKPKKSNDDGMLMAVISFDDQLQAKEAYTKIRKNRINFDDVLKKNNGTVEYSWVKNKDISFYENIRYLSLRRSSKPIETDWGYSLVRIQKKGKMPLISKDVASGQGNPAIQALLEKFKKDPKLNINTDLLYSLKIKK